MCAIFCSTFKQVFALEHDLQRVANQLHLRLVESVVKWQGDRALADRFGDGVVALLEAELLTIERLEVDARKIVRGPDLVTLQALDDAGLGVDDVDALINTSVSRDYLEPATATLMSSEQFSI